MNGTGKSLLVLADSLEGGMGAAAVAHCAMFATAGWRVSLGAPGARLASPEGVQGHDLAVPGSAFHAVPMLRAVAQLRRLLRETSPTITHVHGLRTYSLLLASGRRGYITLHGGGRNPGQSSLATFVRDRARDLVPALADGAFSVAPREGGRWQTLMPPSPRLPEVEGIVDQPPSETPLFLFVGRLAPPKRPDVFVDAVRMLRDFVPDVRGVIVGDGPGREELLSQLNAAGAPVQLIGQTDDVGSWYRRAWAVCLFSDFEGMPFVVQEAMWAGRPLVASPLPGIRWFAADAISYAADAASAAREMHTLCDETVRAERGRAARNRVQMMMAEDALYDALVRAYGQHEDRGIGQERV